MGTSAIAPGSVAPTTSRPPYIAIIGVFVAITAALTAVVSYFSAQVDRSSNPVLQGPVWLDGWFQGDSGWYLLIARDGYFYDPHAQSPVAFFPSYPMAVRGLGWVLGDYQIAGSLIGVACGLAVVLLFAGWVWRRLPRPAAITAIAVMMLYPYASVLYGLMYGDSLFILTALGAFVLLERRQYWLAGLVGALATAGRPVGVAVAIGLVVRMLELLAEDRAAATSAAVKATTAHPADPADAGAGTENSAVAHPTSSGTVPRPGMREVLGAIPAVRWREAGVLLSALGLAAWCVYLWVQFGDPLAFVAAQSAPGWDQGSGPRTWFKISYFGTLLHGPVDVLISLTAQALMCLLGLLLLHRVWKRFGWGYLAFAVVVLAIPILGTKDFEGTGRYVMAAFPVVAAAGDFLATNCPRWLRMLVLTALAAGLVVVTVFLALGDLV